MVPQLHGPCPRVFSKRARAYLRTKAEFADVQLHVEFATPSEVKGDSQGRGNSGVFLAGVFEIQVLDSFENPTYPDGQAAAMYGQHPPLVNASRRPENGSRTTSLFAAPAVQFARTRSSRPPS